MTFDRVAIPLYLFGLSMICPKTGIRFSGSCS